MWEDYKTVVARLRREREMSLEDLAFEARLKAPKGSISLSLIQKRLAPGSTAQPSIGLLTALAAALKVDPNVFVEYRLAAFRAQFDEHAAGGLEAPMLRLTEVDDFLQERKHLAHTVEVQDLHDHARVGTLRLQTLMWGVDTDDLTVVVDGKPADDTVHQAIRNLIDALKATTPQTEEQLVKSGLAGAQRTADRALGLFEDADPPDGESQQRSNELEERRRKRQGNQPHDA